MCVILVLSVCQLWNRSFQINELPIGVKILIWYRECKVCLEFSSSYYPVHREVSPLNMSELEASYEQEWHALTNINSISMFDGGLWRYW